MPTAAPRPGWRPSAAQRVERLRALGIVPDAHDVRHRGTVDAQQRPVAERRARAGSSRPRPVSPPSPPAPPGARRRSPRAEPCPGTSGVSRTSAPAAYAAWSRLAAGPRRGVRGCERPERRREDQQERGAGVAQRPARDLAAAERRHEPAGRGRGGARRARRAAGTNRTARTAPPSSPIAGAATRSGSTPERAARGAGERRAVQPQLEERDRRPARRARGPAPAAAAASGRPGARPRRGRRRSARPRAASGSSGRAIARTPPTSADRERAPAGQRRLRPTPSSAGLSRTAWTRSAADARVRRSPPGPSRAAPRRRPSTTRCPNPPPRARRSAVSVRRRSRSSAATRITA